MALTFRVGTSIYLGCVSPWQSYDGDYEIIGRTTVQELGLMGIDYYEKNFAGRDQDELYDLNVEKNSDLYILKSVTRSPFEYEDDDDEIDRVIEYLYIPNDFIDFNKTYILAKRSNLSVLIDVGNFYSSSIEYIDDVVHDENVDEGFLIDPKDEPEDSEEDDDDIIREDYIVEYPVRDFFNELIPTLKVELYNLLSGYSDRFKIDDIILTTILQPLEEAKEEDINFVKKREEIEEKKRQEEEAYRQRLQNLVNRENRVKEIEKTLSTYRKQLEAENDRLKDYESKLKEEEIRLQNLSNSLARYETTLAEKEAKLNKRAQAIYEREEELGIPHAQL